MSKTVKNEGIIIYQILTYSTAFRRFFFCFVALVLFFAFPTGGGGGGGGDGDLIAFAFIFISCEVLKEPIKP